MSKQTNTKGDSISRSALLEMLRYNKEVHTDETGETRQLIAIDIDKLIDYVENMPAAFDWVPVKERLPEEGQEVLASVKEIDPSAKNRIIIIRYNAEAFWLRHISAWSPLPEYYKEN